MNHKSSTFSVEAAGYLPSLIAVAEAARACCVDHLPHRTDVSGTGESLRASGYLGAIPTDKGMTRAVGYDSGRRESIRMARENWYVWSIYLEPGELQERANMLDALDGPIDDTRLLAGWFTQDRQKLAALAAERIEILAGAGRGGRKGIRELAQALGGMLTSPDFQPEWLKAALDSKACAQHVGG